MVRRNGNSTGIMGMIPTIKASKMALFGIGGRDEAAPAITQERQGIGTTEGPKLVANATLLSRLHVGCRILAARS